MLPPDENGSAAAKRIKLRSRFKLTSLETLRAELKAEVEKQTRDRRWWIDAD